MQSNAIADMVSTVMNDQDYLTRKLEHYNAWLRDPNRKLTAPYPGFPDQHPADWTPPSFAASKAKGKKLTVVEQIEKVQAKAEAKAEKKAVKAKPAKSVGSSKQDRAVALYREFNGDRKQTIQAIMEQLGMSTAGATTYFYNAKKLAV